MVLWDDRTTDTTSIPDEQSSHMFSSTAAGHEYQPIGCPSVVVKKSHAMTLCRKRNTREIESHFKELKIWLDEVSEQSVN